MFSNCVGDVPSEHRGNGIADLPFGFPHGGRKREAVREGLEPRGFPKRYAPRKIVVPLAVAVMLSPYGGRGQTRPKLPVALFRASRRLAPNVPEAPVLVQRLQVEQGFPRRHVDREQRLRVLENLIVCADDEDPFPHLRHTEVCGPVEMVVDVIAGRSEVFHHHIEHPPPVALDESLHVLGDEDSWLHSSDNLDHLSIQNRAASVLGLLDAVDRHVLTGKATDHHIGFLGQAVQTCRDVACDSFVP